MNNAKTDSYNVNGRLRKEDSGRSRAHDCRILISRTSHTYDQQVSKTPLSNCGWRGLLYRFIIRNCIKVHSSRDIAEV